MKTADRWRHEPENRNYEFFHTPEGERECRPGICVLCGCKFDDGLPGVCAAKLLLETVRHS